MRRPATLAISDPKCKDLLYMDRGKKKKNVQDPCHYEYELPRRRRQGINDTWQNAGGKRALLKWTIIGFQAGDVLERRSGRVLQADPSLPAPKYHAYNVTRDGKPIGCHIFHVCPSQPLIPSSMETSLTLYRSTPAPASFSAPSRPAEYGGGDCSDEHESGRSSNPKIVDDRTRSNHVHQAGPGEKTFVETPLTSLDGSASAVEQRGEGPGSPGPTQVSASKRSSSTSWTSATGVRPQKRARFIACAAITTLALAVLIYASATWKVPVINSCANHKCPARFATFGDPDRCNSGCVQWLLPPSESDRNSSQHSGSNADSDHPGEDSGGGDLPVLFGAATQVGAVSYRFGGIISTASAAELPDHFCRCYNETDVHNKLHVYSDHPEGRTRRREFVGWGNNNAVRAGQWPQRRAAVRCPDRTLISDSLCIKSGASNLCLGLRRRRRGVWKAPLAPTSSTSSASRSSREPLRTADS
eukprot:SAG31_NODE_3173_length_4588_cov_3.009388_3_plen_472_part_00